MSIGIVAPRQAKANPGTAAVGADGAVRVGETELRRLGVAAGSALEAVRVPGGLLLRAPDGCLSKVYVELTTACDLDCPMCMRRVWEEPGGTMVQQTFHRLVEHMAEMPGASTLQFGGFGEPARHPAFFDFLSVAKAVGLEVEVVTNGTFLDAEAAHRLMDLRVDRLLVSVDGVSASGGSLLHGASPAAVLNRLRMLNRLKVRRGTSRPEVGLVFVATRRNIAELPALKRLAIELGYTSVLVTNLVAYTPELAGELLYERWTTATRPRPPSACNPQVDLPLMDAYGEAGPAVARLQIT